MILEVLEFGFMQSALIAGISVAITSSVIGLFLVLRRNSLFGDALSHAEFGGIAIGLATNIYPLWTGLTLSILGAVGITKLRQYAKIPADATVAILLSSGLALGILLISISGGFTLDLFRLFVWKYHACQRRGHPCDTGNDWHNSVHNHPALSATDVHYL